MKIVEAQEAREKLTMPVCIDLMRTALKELDTAGPLHCGTSGRRKIWIYASLVKGQLRCKGAGSMSTECRNRLSIPHWLCDDV